MQTQDQNQQATLPALIAELKQCQQALGLTDRQLVACFPNHLPSLKTLLLRLYAGNFEGLDEAKWSRRLVAVNFVLRTRPGFVRSKFPDAINFAAA